MKAAITILGVCICVLGTVASAEEATLKPVMTPGRKVVFDRETNVKQILKLAGMDLETEVVATETRMMKFGDKSPAGGATIDVTTPKMQLNLNAPGGISIAFYSDTPDQTKVDNEQLQGLVDLLKVTIKAHTKIQFDGSGKIATVKMEGEGLENLPDQYRSRLSEESLKRSLETEFYRYPDKPVEPGNTWTRAEYFNAGSGQSFTYMTTYKYEGREDKDGKSLDKVTATLDKVEFALASDSPIPLQLKSSDLNIGDSKVTYWFDPERKLIAVLDSTLKITGKVEFTANGQDLPAELDLTIATKTNVTSVNDPE